MSRCIICKAKIPSLFMMSMYTCRCKGIYCSKHIQAHDCQFDYKSLNKNLPKKKNNKIKKI